MPQPQPSLRPVTKEDSLVHIVHHRPYIWFCATDLFTHIFPPILFQ